jgi:hypothetical protein
MPEGWRGPDATMYDADGDDPPERLSAWWSARCDHGLV